MNRSGQGFTQFQSVMGWASTSFDPARYFVFHTFSKAVIIVVVIFLFFSITLQATAGLRQLGSNTSEEILEAVKVSPH